MIQPSPQVQWLDPTHPPHTPLPNGARARRRGTSKESFACSATVSARERELRLGLGADHGLPGLPGKGSVFEWGSLYI